MLRLLPHDRFTLTSAHPVKTLAERLGAVTDPDRPLFVGRDGPRFFGDVDLAGFEIVANIRGRNSFNPIATGNFETSPDGARIHVRMTLQPIVQLFLLIWFSLVVLIGGAIVFSVLTSDKMDKAMALPPLLLIFFGWALTGLFWLEAGRSKADLKEILDAREVQ